MPRDKDLKRLVRARMDRTGESYTAARARIVSKPNRGASAAPRAGADDPSADLADVRVAGPASPDPRDYAQVAGMSDEALEKKTGCGWEKWVYVLDRHRAHEMSHREIARLVHEKYEIDGWWAQCVTVGYERIRGLRERGQRRAGGFEASKSKTVPVPVDVLYDACALARTRRRWIPDADVKVRTAARPRSLRFGLGDGTIAVLWLVPKGDSKSSVTIQHLNLRTAPPPTGRRGIGGSGWTRSLRFSEGAERRPAGTRRAHFRA